MAKWRCTVCDYIHEGPEPPETCPVCGVDASFFEKVEEAAANPCQDEVKKALRHITYGLYIVASRKGEKINGQCANTVFQITSEPVKIAVGINKNNLTYEYIIKSKTIPPRKLPQRKSPGGSARSAATSMKGGTAGSLPGVRRWPRGV